MSGVVDMNKGDFVGRNALQAAAGSRVLRGLWMVDRAIPREHCVVRTAGRRRNRYQWHVFAHA